MSRNQLIRIGMAICGVIIVAAAVISLGGLFSGGLFGYANAEKYTAGEASISDPIRNLDIDWVSGRVSLAWHSGSTVELKETSNKPISADLQLRWWVDGDTLRVRFSKNGFNLSITQEKELTVTLPESISLNSVDISATSGALSIPALRAENLILQTTSGSIQAEAEVKTADVGATSGSVSLKLTGAADRVTLGTTSGSVQVEADRVDSVKATSTSGAISVTANQVGTCEAGATAGNISVTAGEADQVKLGATSGSVSAALNAFTRMEIDTTSGQVTAALPAVPGFTAKLDSVSGKVDYSLPLARKDGAYVCGDGSARVEIGTTSGSIRLEAAAD